MMKRSVKTLIAFCMAALLLAVPAFASEPVEGRAGRAELRFLEGMIDHHQMALDMAGDCLVNGESADLLALCQAVIDAQSAEIAQMQAWLLAWYNVDYRPVSMMPSMEAMADRESSMEGMDHSDHSMGDSAMTSEGPFYDPPMMMGMMAGLNRLSGADYDIAWLESMIDHHDDALHMSERILRYDTIHAETRTLAEAIITAQTDEIALMETMIEAMSS